MNYLWVAIGGALGSVARFWCYDVVARHSSGGFPWNTLFVNVTGSFVIGMFVTLTAPDGQWPVSAQFRHFVAVGFCGGFTTFSAFSLQTLRLLQNRDWLLAGLNMFGSVILCVAGVWLGCWCAGIISRRG